MGTAIDGTAIDEVLRDAVGLPVVPHVAAIAASRDWRDLRGLGGPAAASESDPVTVDTLFRIMSMTKMPATVAALQQVEKGQLDLQAPVADYCPEFAGVQVLTGFDGETPRLRPPARQATVRNLITHTSGLGYWFWSEDLVRWEKATGIPNIVAGSSTSFGAPMLGDPGEAFIYGINVDWLGKVVEAVTSAGLDVAVKEGITGPLGMDQTTFLMNDEQQPNSTPVHVKGEDRYLGVDRRGAEPGPGLLGRRPRAVRAAEYYIKFEQALLRGGELGGTRILQQSTVDEAFRNQIGDLEFPADLPTADPRQPARSTSARLQVGLWAAAQHRRHPGHAARLVRRLGRAVQHAVLGGPQRRRLRLHLRQLPAVRDPRGRADVHRLRKGALRGALTGASDSGVILQR